MREIILASASLGRKEVLGRYTKFKTIVSNVEENKDLKDIKILTTALSFEKGYNVAKNNPEAIIISADTMVTIDGENLGKPKDYDDAYKMLMKLRGRSHEIYTGFTIISLADNFKYSSYEKSIVTFKKFTEEELKAYLDSKEYIGKAGAYTIGGKGGLLISKIEGDYNNVIGLPIQKINDLMYKHLNVNLLWSNGD